MKLINKIGVVLTLASVTLLGACKKDFLERHPTDSILASEALSTESNLQNALNGAYGGMRSATLFGRNFPVIGDLHADNTFVEQKNAGRYLLWYNYTLAETDGDANDMWTNSYTVIMRVNRIIDADVTGSNVEVIKAEAKAIRAIMYFQLVNMFSTTDPGGMGVPIILHYDPFNLPSRNTVAEVYTQIISDLKDAFAAAGPYQNSARLSKYAIEALLARAYLFTGDFANARTAAEDVINSSGFTLAPATGLRDFWDNSADRTDKMETLFEIDADVLNNNGFDDLGGIYIHGYQDIYASKALYDLYGDDDARKGLMIEGKTKSGADAILVDKFPNAQSNDRDNLKVIRLSEVYLIAAEAAFRSSTPDETSALRFLNELVDHREPGFVYSSTGQQLMDDIITERRKELAFEGDRLFTLNRLHLPIERVVNAGAIPLTGTGLVTPYPDDYRIGPIPQVERLSNPNIKDQQNPGY